MDEKLQQALTRLLDQLSQGIDWTAAQLPAVVNDLIGREIVDNYFVAFFWLFCSLVLLISAKRIKKFAKVQKRDCDECFGITTSIFVTLLSVFCFFGVIYYLREAIGVQLYPKAWLLDYIKDMVNAQRHLRR